MAFDQVPEALHVEAILKHQAGAEGQRGQRRSDPVAVVERHHREKAIGRGEAVGIFVTPSDRDHASL